MIKEKYLYELNKLNLEKDKLKQGIYTEPIDELILKLNKIY